ncbi:hypothetical protein B1H10_01725 [candidate division KSB1 bacterium 4484_188]|nr:MAG: hypothetical protein B1H10_01725 [candidate division KSB1 bacterium 4484_188]
MVKESLGDGVTDGWESNYFFIACQAVGGAKTAMTKPVCQGRQSPYFAKDCLPGKPTADRLLPASRVRNDFLTL